MSPLNRFLFVAFMWLTTGAMMFGAGWMWRGDRAERNEAREQAAAGVAQVRQLNQARTVEHQQADTMANIGAKHEEDRIAATAVPAVVAAGVRDGSLQLRDDLATCNTARLSEAVAGAIERDAHAELRAEVAGALVQIGRDADDHVRACQAVIAADRTEVTP